MKRCLFVLVLSLLYLIVSGKHTPIFADTDGHSHFRFGHITWKWVPNTNTVEFTFTAAFRRCTEPGVGSSYRGSDSDGCPAVGDVIDEWIGGTNLCFGDSNCTGQLKFKVFGIDKKENWLIARALDPNNPSKETITHSYSMQGSFKAYTETCCRIGPPKHINNPHGWYRVEAVVNFPWNTDNPKSLLPPIINCPQNSTCKFSITAVDTEVKSREVKIGQNNLVFTLAGPTEAGFNFRNPDGATVQNKIDKIDGKDTVVNEGEYIWDTTGAQLNPDGETFYSTQVIIKEIDDQNNLISKSALDFFIRLVPIEETISEKEIKVPIRWCYAEDVFDIDDDDEPDKELLDRLACVNNNVFGPQVNLQFISPLGGTSIQHFPTIDGSFKKIFQKQCPESERWKQAEAAVNACRKKWEELAPSVTGVVAVLIDDIEGATAGLGWKPEPGDVAYQILNSGILVEKDSSECGLFWEWLLFGFAHKVGHTLGHEFSHALSLNHGNGIDDDNDNDIDEESDKDFTGDVNLDGSPGKGGTDDDCDGQVDEGNINDDDEDGMVDEDCPIVNSQAQCDGPPPSQEKSNLMGYAAEHLHNTPFFGKLKSTDEDRKTHHIFLTQEQTNRLRNQALLVPDSKIDPVPLPLASTRTDELKDTPFGEEFIDINTYGLVSDPTTKITTFALSTSGVPPENFSNFNFIFIIDTDNNISTGGAPSALGLSTSSQGIELAGQVSVEINNGVSQIIPTLWRYDEGSGQFIEIVDPSIKGRIDPIVIVADVPLHSNDSIVTQSGQIIRLEVSDSLIPPFNINGFFIEAVAENSTSGIIDNAKAGMNFEVPNYPICEVSPSNVILSSDVTVNATNLPPNSLIEVFLGSELVATGSTDSVGHVSIPFKIPEDTSTGSRPVSVIKPGTGISANCHINLQGPPLFNVPPSPAVGEILNVSVGSPLNFSIEASDPDEANVVTLGVIGIPRGASFPIPSPANLVSSIFTWTPSIGQDGDYIIVFTAQDDTGLSAPPHSITIRVGANQPPIAHAGTDQILECTSPTGTSTTLDGSSSNDPDGDPLTYNWTGCFGAASGVNPVVDVPIGVCSVDLVVNDGQINSDPDSVTITVQDTTPPELHCPADVTEECTAPSGQAVNLGTPIVSDTCSSNIAVSNNALALFTLGTTPVTWTALDEHANSSQGIQSVTIVDTTPPNLQVPPDIIEECNSPNGQVVNLGTATASDACSDDIAISNNVPSLFTLGSTSITWTATDESRNSSQGNQSVGITDTTPPLISMTCSPNILWPPNHTMVEITPTVIASDICDASINVGLYQITMNEGDETNTYDLNYDDTTGDGHTLNDIEVTSDGHIYLRAERSGNNPAGRKYTIIYRSTDDSGNSSTASCEVTVPHDMK